jgi:hypothetical protein
MGVHVLTKTCRTGGRGSLPLSKPVFSLLFDIVSVLEAGEREKKVKRSHCPLPLSCCASAFRPRTGKPYRERGRAVASSLCAHTYIHCGSSLPETPSEHVKKQLDTLGGLKGKRQSTTTRALRKSGCTRLLFPLHFCKHHSPGGSEWNTRCFVPSLHSHCFLSHSSLAHHFFSVLLAFCICVFVC